MSEETTDSVWTIGALKLARLHDMERQDGSLWGVVRAMQAAPHRHHALLMLWLALRGTQSDELDEYLMQWLARQDASGALLQTLTGLVYDYHAPDGQSVARLHVTLDLHLAILMPQEVGKWSIDWIRAVVSDGAGLVPESSNTFAKELAYARLGGELDNVSDTKQAVSRLIRMIYDAYHSNGESPHPTYHTKIAPQPGARLLAALWEHYDVPSKMRALDLCELRSLMEVVDAKRS